MPEIAKTYSFPRSVRDEGVRRYGFHGLSYEHVVRHVGSDVLKRAVIAHLGNGSSLCAVRDGKSLDTSMGFSPAGGVVMGSRSGDVDPGVLLYLMRERGYKADGLADLINGESGLLGLSGSTSNMRTLLETRTSDSQAALAVDVFCYGIRKQIGAYAAVLGGVDSIVFTGGIGENSSVVRAQILEGLDFLGDFRVIVVPADEELMIAGHAFTVGLP